MNKILDFKILETEKELKRLKQLKLVLEITEMVCSNKYHFRLTPHKNQCGNSYYKIEIKNTSALKPRFHFHGGSKEKIDKLSDLEIKEIIKTKWKLWIKKHYPNIL